MNHKSRKFTIVGKMFKEWRFEPYDEIVVGIPNQDEIIEFDGQYFRKVHGHLCPDVTEMVVTYWEERQAEVDATYADLLAGTRGM